MKERLPPEVARALAVLWLRRGEVLDFIGWIKSKDPRNVDVPKAEAALAELEKQLECRDITRATEAAYWLDQIFFNLRVSEAAPLARAGRKQRAGREARRDAYNAALHSERSAEWARWNAEAAKYWKPGATKNSVARLLKRRFGLTDTEGAIARRLKKPRQAS
jgi:hypothetical protein